MQEQKMDLITSEQIKMFSNFLDKYEHFFIIGHKEPDGDCISSCLGLAEIVKAKGKKYTLLSNGPFKRPEIKKFARKFKNEVPFLDKEEAQKTGLIITDCSEIHRLGEIGEDLKNYEAFIVDHHKTSDGSIENAIVNSTAPAAALIVQMLYEGIIGELTKNVAEILFFGLSTDTGYFRFLTDKESEVFIASARLVKAGANPKQTYNEITGGKSWNTRKLLGLMLERAERYYNGRLVITYETLEDTKKLGQEGRDSDALYSTVLSCDEVEAVVFIRQDSESSCTFGLRSKDKIDVSKIASQFGGGGHKNASGGSTEQTIQKLIPAMNKAFSSVFN